MIEPGHPDLAEPIQAVVNAAREALVAAYVAPPAPTFSLGPWIRPGPPMFQKTTMIPLPPSAETLPLDDLREHYLRPAMAALAASVPRGSRFADLEIPPGMCAARSSDAHFSILGVFAWVRDSIYGKEGEPVTYGAPYPALRFDILLVTP